MNRYISLLRGINVSGQKKIKMADLKEMYETLSCEKVITYIQSGNVIFDHPSSDPTEIKKLIERAIKEKYQFSVYVDVITPKIFFKAREELPFTGFELSQDGSKIFMAFLSKTPENENITTLNQYVFSPDELIISGKILYLHLPNGAGKSKLSTNFIESKLKLTTTMRNLKTVVKLCELAEE